MKIAVYQGERDLIKENRKLAEFDLKNIPAMPAGLPKVDINFLLNADGILTVQAHELRSGVKQQVEIKPSYGLTDQEVEKMLLESVQHAKEDIDQRMFIEAKTEAEQMIYTVKRFLDRHQNTLSETEIKDTEQSIKALKDAISSENKDLILKSIDQLNEFTRPFAERVMDQAIAQAMKGKAIE